MLEGITRQTVIEIAQSLGISVHIRPVTAAEFRAADEAFISSSGGGVLPVTRVDGQNVADGLIGAVTRRLSQTYWEWHQHPAMRVPIDYAPVGST
jgi:branched-chain amino acid aminotransferase